MRHLVPIFLVIVVTLSVSFGGAIGVLFVSSGSSWWNSQPVASILVYQIDPRVANDNMASVEQVLPVLERRLNPSRWTKTARIRALDGGLIEVGLFSRNQDDVRRASRLVEAVGAVEFRLLAVEWAHSALVRAANNLDPQTDVVRNANGLVVGRWIETTAAVTLPESGSGGVPGNLTERHVDRNGRTVRQVLVVDDGSASDVAGALTVGAALSKNYQGRSQVSIELSDMGQRRLLALTANPAGPAASPWLAGRANHVAILVDGHAVAVADLRDDATRYISIGSLTSEPEGQEFVDLINAGRLPVPLKPIDSSTPRNRDG